MQKSGAYTTKLYHLTSPLPMLYSEVELSSNAAGNTVVIRRFFCDGALTVVHNSILYS